MSGRPILVVDDDPVILATLAQCLSDEGYTAETASNGLEALQIVRRMPPCVVLLDMQMPVLDGLGFAREVHNRRRNLKIIVMTAASDAAACAQRIEADGYLIKPFDLEHLFAEVERVWAPVGAPAREAASGM
jgi:CheY-like chemotaxis protein